LYKDLIGKKSLYKVNTLRADNSHVSSNAIPLGYNVLITNVSGVG